MGAGEPIKSSFQAGVERAPSELVNEVEALL